MLRIAKRRRELGKHEASSHSVFAHVVLLLMLVIVRLFGRRALQRLLYPANRRPWGPTAPHGRRVLVSCERGVCVYSATYEDIH